MHEAFTGLLGSRIRLTSGAVGCPVRSEPESFEGFVPCSLLVSQFIYYSAFLRRGRSVVDVQPLLHLCVRAACARCAGESSSDCLHKGTTGARYMLITLC